MEDSCIKVFPWTNRGEFKRVFRELYSSKKSLQKHALDRIEIWKTRVSKLPVAVDATAQLVRYSMQDLEDVDRAHALGFMIMKFVNNITEGKQQKLHKKSIVHIAAEMGIERWIVNIRHQIAHGEMPSIHLLLAAAKSSLHWLKVNFWEIQAQQPEDPDLPVDERLVVLKNLLDDYLKDRYKKFGSKKRGTDPKLQKQIEQAIFGLGNNSFTVLVDSWYLIIREDELSKINLTYRDIFREPSGIPDTLYDLWSPVLTILDKIGLIPHLLLHMASVLTHDSTYRNRCVYGWMYAILVHRETWTSDIPCKQLLDTTLQITSQYALPVLLLLIELVDESRLNQTKKTHLVRELKKFYGTLDMEECLDQSEQDKEDQLMDDLPDIKKSIWTKCFDQVHWSRYPFGLLPNHIPSYKNLELDWSRDKEEEELVAMEDEETTTNEFETLDRKANLDGNSDRSAVCEPLWSKDEVKQIMDGIVLF